MFSVFSSHWFGRCSAEGKKNTKLAKPKDNVCVKLTHHSKLNAKVYEK